GKAQHDLPIADDDPASLVDLPLFERLLTLLRLVLSGRLSRRSAGSRFGAGERRPRCARMGGADRLVAHGAPGSPSGSECVRREMVSSVVSYGRMRSSEDVARLVRARSPLPPDETERLLRDFFVPARAVRFVCDAYRLNHKAVLD